MPRDDGVPLPGCDCLIARDSPRNRPVAHQKSELGIACIVVQHIIADAAGGQSLVGDDHHVGGRVQVHMTCEGEVHVPAADGGVV